jgi:hypothetical protein
MKDKIKGHSFRAFIIDGHGGRLTDAGSGRSTEEQYEEALRRHGVRSYDTGSGFIWGADSVDAGIMACRDWLRRGEDGKPKVQVFNTLEHFDKEIRFYHNKRIAGRISDRPDPKSASHLMDCFRYLVMHDPRYYKLPPKSRDNYVLRALRHKEERKRMRDGPITMRLGPGRK